MNSEREERELLADLQRRRVFRPAPRRLGDAVNDLLARRGYAQVAGNRQFQTAWRKAVGDRWSRVSRAGALRRGVLQVVVQNSIALQELTLAKPDVLKRLRDLLPETAIRDVRLSVGAVD